MLNGHGENRSAWVCPAYTALARRLFKVSWVKLQLRVFLAQQALLLAFRLTRVGR